jgi:hypothetical protein
MATTKFKTKLINLKALAENSDVSIHKLYNRRHSETKKPLDLVDKTKLLNTLTKEVTKFSKDLGFTVEITLQENPTH